MSPMCTYGQNIETTSLLRLHHPNHHCARETFSHKVNQVSGNISRQVDSTIIKILLFGDNELDFETTKLCLQSSSFH